MHAEGPHLAFVMANTDNVAVAVDVKDIVQDPALRRINGGIEIHQPKLFRVDGGSMRARLRSGWRWIVPDATTIHERIAEDHAIMIDKPRTTHAAECTKIVDTAGRVDKFRKKYAAASGR